MMFFHEAYILSLRVAYIPDSTPCAIYRYQNLRHLPWHHWHWVQTFSNALCTGDCRPWRCTFV